MLLKILLVSIVGFISAIMFLIAVVFSLGLMIVSRQHKTGNELKKRLIELDDSENFY